MPRHDKLPSLSEPGGEGGVKSVDRAARLLKALAQGDRAGTMLTDIAELSGLGKGTTHRLLSALIDVGFVFQDSATRLYRLGSGLATLAHKAHQQEFTSLAQPCIARIAEQTGDTVYASVREGVAAICVGRAIGDYPIRTVSLDVGHRRPLGVGSGSLALLAFLPDAEIEDIIRCNEAWLKRYPTVSADVLWRLVEQTRARGYSLFEGLILPGMHAIGMPVYDPTRRPVASISLSAIADRMHPQRVVALAQIVASEATELEQAAEALSRPDQRPISKS